MWPLRPSSLRETLARASRIKCRIAMQQDHIGIASRATRLTAQYASGHQGRPEFIDTVRDMQTSPNLQEAFDCDRGTSSLAYTKPDFQAMTLDEVQTWGIRSGMSSGSGDAANTAASRQQQPRRSGHCSVNFTLQIQRKCTCTIKDRGLVTINAGARKARMDSGLYAPFTILRAWSR